jgi:hypothetical protein
MQRKIAFDLATLFSQQQGKKEVRSEPPAEKREEACAATGTVR